jgi:hypothetical protein
MISKYFLDAAVNKFFLAMHGIAQRVTFEIVIDQLYSAETDTTKKRTEKITVNYIPDDNTQEQDDGAGMQKKEVVIYCKSSDFKRLPTVKDLFFLKEKCFNVTKVENSYNCFLRITGEK